MSVFHGCDIGILPRPRQRERPKMEEPEHCGGSGVSIPDAGALQSEAHGLPDQARTGQVRSSQVRSGQAAFERAWSTFSFTPCGFKPQALILGR